MFLFQAEDGIRDKLVTGVQTCALFFQAEDGIRDKLVTGVQTCALPIQAEDGIRDKLVTGVQTCALPIYFDRENVQQALEAILADQQSAPLSMREVARRLGYPVRTIETHFPQLCRDISRRSAAYRKQQGQRRKARLRQRITEAARIVLMQGENLTFRRVGTIIGEPGCFREHEARLVLRDIRRRLDAESSLE